jgi:hypothetical protein
MSNTLAKRINLKCQLRDGLILCPESYFRTDSGVGTECGIAPISAFIPTENLTHPDKNLSEKGIFYHLFSSLVFLRPATHGKKSSVHLN